MLSINNAEQFDRTSDGVIHLTLTQLEVMVFEVLDAQLNADYTQNKLNTITELSGYLELVTSTSPKLSIGLDWSFVNGDYVIVGDPFVNFIICDESGCHMNTQEVYQCVKSHLFMNNWSALLSESLKGTYK
ncbi:DUF4902 domain-containing protein [Vibrio lentus]|uniref:DUF4902 domain-containing protein n=1 Tax=Vibrio lentus TaxID=136468 RepID=UPI001E55ECC8|nr:DUF4902 domain-containing protein [Vibrio lentus]MCC4838062.1 DUF4902 domain-containing protein [Vibrio lentus]